MFTPEPEDNKFNVIVQNALAVKPNHIRVGQKKWNNNNK